MIRLFRLFQILIIVTRYRAFFILRDINTKKAPDVTGKKFTNLLESLGPIFIKFGQTLSARPDLVGEEVAENLARLQDKLPEFSYKIAKQIIEKEFGGNIQDFYNEFQEKPISAASISQVHKAKTKEGNIVAVKVLRPKINKLFKRDIDLFYLLARLIEMLSKRSKRLRLTEVVATFENTVKLELNLRYEAAAASELKENCVDDPNVHIPYVYWELTGEKILTTEWIDGIPIENTKALINRGFDLEIIAANLAISFFNQAYQDGFFHADLHPGNILIDQQGRFIAEVIRGFLDKDYQKVARLHFAIGFVPQHKSKEEFSQACRAIGEQITGKSVTEVSVGNLLSQLFKMQRSFDMETQPQLLLLHKTILLVEGIGCKLDPGVNMWKLAGPWIEKWAIRNIGIEAKLFNGVQDLYNLIKRNITEESKEEKLIEEIDNKYIYSKIIVLSVAVSSICFFILNKII
jgi:ubiquinone biosynthesis protein